MIEVSVSMSCRTRRPFLTIAALASSLVFACSSDTTGSSAGEVSQVLLTVEGPTDTIRSLGGEVRVRLVARDAGGHTLSSVTSAWTATDPSVLQIVATDSAGAVVKGLQNGAASIQVLVRARSQRNGVAAAKAIVVRQEAVKLVIVQQGYSMQAAVPAIIGVFTDHPLQVEARPVDALGSYVSGAVPAVFAVDDSTIVRSSTSGVVIGIREGTTTLRAQSTDRNPPITGSVDVGIRRPL